MHIVTIHNYSESHQALRDILFMYVDLAENSGFAHAIDTGIFDPFQFIDAIVEVAPEYASPVDIDLLRQGSAISVLCTLYNMWSEFDSVNLECLWSERLHTAITQARFAYCPDVEQLLIETFERNPGYGDTWLEEQLKPIYKKYVADYFTQLAFLSSNGIDRFKRFKN